MDRQSIVITGLGTVSSAGEGVNNFFNSLCEGRTFISEVTEFDTTNHLCKKASLINNFDPFNYLGKKSDKYGRTTQLTISSVLLALEDSKMSHDYLKSKKVGIILGTAMGESRPLDAMCVIDLENKAPDKNEVLKLPDNMIASNTAGYLNINAYTLMIPNACSAGNYAMAYSMELLKQGKIDIAITGGCDSFTKYAFFGFDRMMSLSPDLCRPFDKNRKGIIIGEGAGIIIMERMEDAQKRNTGIYSEMAGYGFSSDSFHMTIPHEEGIIRVLRNVLNNSGIDPSEVDLVSAHGTGTPMNDKLECRALNEVFKKSLEKIPVISIKSMIGHTMGASSALEAITCIMSIKHSKIPPTANFETYDPECAVDCVPNKMREKNIDTAMNNNFAFGGNNAGVIFKKIG